MESQFEEFRYACKNGNIGVVQESITTVLKNNPDDLIPMISSDNYLSLSWACQGGHIEIVKLIIETVLQHNNDYLMPMIRSDGYETFRHLAIL